MRVFESSRNSKSPDGPHHCDLCDKHIQAAHLQYVKVAEYELGVCPQTCEFTV